MKNCSTSSPPASHHAMPTMKGIRAGAAREAGGLRIEEKPPRRVARALARSRRKQIQNRRVDVAVRRSVADRLRKPFPRRKVLPIFILQRARFEHRRKLLSPIRQASRGAANRVAHQVHHTEPASPFAPAPAAAARFFAGFNAASDANLSSIDELNSYSARIQKIVPPLPSASPAARTPARTPCPRRSISRDPPARPRISQSPPSIPRTSA